jgi:hypothetical protein
MVIVSVRSGKEKPWQKKRRLLRDRLWPEADNVVFTGKDEGYCKVVPRILPLVCVLANFVKLRSGDLTPTYMDLWLRTDGDGFVDVPDELECAASAGFLGSRALWSWRERVRELKRLGLVKVEGEGHREIRYILLVRPDLAVSEMLKAHGKKVPKIWRDYYEKRGQDIGVNADTNSLAPA